MIKFTPEQIEKFPVNHLSFSAIRSYMTDRQMFYKRYLRMEFDDVAGPSLFQGKAFHLGLELIFNQLKASEGQNLINIDEVIQVASEYFIREAECLKIDFGKTGSVDKSLKVIDSALRFYYDFIFKKGEFLKKAFLVVEQNYD